MNRACGAASGHGRRAARMHVLGLAACTALGWAACALPRPRVDDVLAGSPGVASADVGNEVGLAALGERLQREADSDAALARNAAQEWPDDPAVLCRAARALFEAADLRIQRAMAAEAGESTAPDVDWLIDAGDRLDDELRAAVLALSEEGLELSESALELDEQHTEGLLQRALHLSMLAWSEGVTRALVHGLGPRLSKAIERAVEHDAEHDGAAPLRLAGRFLTRAPWPYRDRDEARADLERAVNVAPLPVNYLFLGDTQYLLDEREAAMASWRAALGAAADDTTRRGAPFHRELARARLAALERERRAEAR